MMHFAGKHEPKKVALIDHSLCLKTAFFTALTALFFINAVMPEAHAKRPGSTYCFVGKCHRVKTLNETRSLVGKTVPLVASHYSDCRKDRFNPCGLTSSGEPFHPDRPDNAASPVYPDGTVLLVRNPKTKASVVLRINNAGPYWGNRKLDVSEAAAEKLGFRRRGVAKLETKILSAPNKKEARYSRRRKYRSLPGFIGKYDSLKEAERTAVALMMLDATAASVIAPSNSAAMLTATRSESDRQRERRHRDRKKLEPIIKTMRLISEMKPATAKATVVADALISDSSSTHQLNSAAMLTATRSESDRQRERRHRDRKKLEPIIKTMRLISEMKPATAKATVVADALISDSSSTHQLTDGPSYRYGQATSPAGNELAPQDKAPNRQLARAALAELTAENDFLEHRTKLTSVELIRTAEVGAPSNNAWQDLLHTRLAPLSGENIWGGTLPYLPLPGRPPRRYVPGAPTLARNEMMD